MIDYRLELHKKFISLNQAYKECGISPQTIFNNFGSVGRPKDKPKLVNEMAMLAYLINKNGYNLYELAGVSEYIENTSKNGISIEKTSPASV